MLGALFSLDPLNQLTKTDPPCFTLYVIFRHFATPIKKKGIRLYIVSVEPQMATDDYAPERRLLERITEKTGGASVYLGPRNDFTRYLSRD